jgi:hypothetical protein
LSIITLLAWVIGCGQSPPPAPVFAVELPPDLPTLQLPTVDLAKTVQRANKGPAKLPLGKVLNQQKFIVRFDAHRAVNSPPAPHVGHFGVGLHWNGRYLESAECHVFPTNDVNEAVVHYAGVCSAPNRTGDAVVEIRFANDAYLVRYTTVE